MGCDGCPLAPLLFSLSLKLCTVSLNLDITGVVIGDTQQKVSWTTCCSHSQALQSLFWIVAANFKNTDPCQTWRLATRTTDNPARYPKVYQTSFPRRSSLLPAPHLKHSDQNFKKINPPSPQHGQGMHSSMLEIQTTYIHRPVVHKSGDNPVKWSLRLSLSSLEYLKKLGHGPRKPPIAAHWIPVK